MIHGGMFIVETEYLFVNLKWNQISETEDIKYREPIQIGIVAADEDLQKEKIFSKAIRLSDPTHINKGMLKLYRTTLENIMNANTKEDIFGRVVRTFPTYKYIVTWNREIYSLFKYTMKQCGFSMRRHTVIILQDILSIVASDGKRRIGFSQALEYADIEYEPNYLNYSIHDANYLYQLFKETYQQYSSMTSDDYRITNVKTKRMHASECHYARKMKIDHATIRPQSAIFIGFKMCQACASKLTWNQLKWDEKVILSKKEKEIAYLRQLPLTEEKMEKICKQFGVTYNISNDVVFIKTEFSSWIVYLRDGKVHKLYHENYRQSASAFFKMQKKKLTEGYHQQKLLSDHFYDVVQYIKYHDKGTVKRMEKKSRIERLFEKIEREKRENT